MREIAASPAGHAATAQMMQAGGDQHAGQGGERPACGAAADSGIHTPVMHGRAWAALAHPEPPGSRLHASCVLHAQGCCRPRRALGLTLTPLQALLPRSDGGAAAAGQREGRRRWWWRHQENQRGQRALPAWKPSVRIAGCRPLGAGRAGETRICIQAGIKLQLAGGGGATGGGAPPASLGRAPLLPPLCSRKPGPPNPVYPACAQSWGPSQSPDRSMGQP